MSSAANVYISASANRHARVAHASSSSLVAFGSSNVVALWDPADAFDRGVFLTLPGHEGVVTCIRFLDKGDDFISADDKGSVRLWRKLGAKWTTTCNLQAHKNAISALAVHGDCILTGGSDATVKIWTYLKSVNGEKDQLEEVQQLDLRNRYPLDLQVAFLPGTSNLVLAIAATDRDVGIWIRSEEHFIKAASLAGHEDWVKSLAFQEDVSGTNTLTLASGSHDGTIRLWNIEQYANPQLESEGQLASSLGDDLVDEFEAALGDIGEGEEGGRQITMKRHILTAKTSSESSQRFSITFDALLIGHEAGVTSLAWRPRRSATDSTPTLLSTSTDSSLILWSPSSIGGAPGVESTSLWINHQRFGDIGGQRLGGFVGALWAKEGDDTLAWGWRGGWRAWHCTSAVNGVSIDTWNEVGAITGHNGPVRGLCWSPEGEYLMSTSTDQTTRIHVNINGASPDLPEVWHEIARPQVHGYDLLQAVFITPLRFVSVADEKVARVFDAPQNFLQFARRLGVLSHVDEENEKPVGAVVPPLGLSNKAINHNAVDEQQLPSHLATLDRRPFEGELSTSTLWPEIEKIFGHNYELMSLAVSHNGQYIATACKATALEHAVVRVHNTTTWQPFGQVLYGHSSTVTRIKFSPNSQFILSVSRDRSWMISALQQDEYVPVIIDKSHGRIIWDCSWAPENDIFATASRDKTVRIWGLKDKALPETWTIIATLKLSHAATAVAFGPTGMNRQTMAIGMENGEILIYTAMVDVPHQWRQDLKLDSYIAHVSHIHSLDWRPRSSQDVSGKYSLASCSDDGTVRIINIHLHQF